MKGCTAAAAALAMLATAACRSSEPVPPSLPLVIPESERPESGEPPSQPAADPDIEDRHGYVVDTSGDNAADGTAEAPWRTLDHAASKVEPGSTVIVRAGHYRGFSLSTSGRAEQPIRFLAKPGAIIDDPAHPDGINLEGASFVEIRGFRITGAARAGIRAVDCEHVTIRDNVVDNNGKWGILTGFCDDLKIVDNESSRAVEQHGIYVGNTTARPLVQGNEVWGNRLGGVHVNGDRHMGQEGIVTEARIIGNVIRDNGKAGASGINLDGVRDSVIANNLLYGNESTGIALYRIDGGKPSTGNAIVHNTVVMPRHKARWALLLRDGATDNTIYNNIFVNEHPRRGAIMASRDSLRGLKSDANLLTERFTVDDGNTTLGLNAWRELTGQDGHSGPAPAIDALFADPRQGDFRPTPESPARAAGRPLPRKLRGRAFDLLAEDLAGSARPGDHAPDLGCFQAAASSGVPKPEAEPEADFDAET